MERNHTIVHRRKIEEDPERKAQEARERMEKHRLKSRINNQNSSQTFANAQVKGKANKKVLDLLSRDPAQQKEVQCVEVFFNDDEISRQSPNKKDFITHTKDDIKVQVQRQAEIQTSDDFKNAVYQENVNVFSMPESEKLARNKKLNIDEIFQNARQIKDISKCHSFKVVVGAIHPEKISIFNNINV